MDIRRLKTIRFAPQVEEKQIAYISSARSIDYDKRQNRIERARESAPRARSKKEVRRENYEKINKKLGGTLTPRQKHASKNLKPIKNRIRKKMIEEAKDVDEANEIRRRLAAGENIPIGRQNTVMGYVYEKKVQSLNRTLYSLKKGEKVADWALREYNEDVMRSMSKIIKKDLKG